MAHLDLVADILDRIASAHGKLPPKVLMAVEADVRADWGGERHYIAKVGESGKAKLAERDKQIRAEHRRGDHDELIARRHDISIKRVRQILAVPFAV
ncbi:Mor transcription activator family protein [Dyella sp.]|uniref:Mor transcription activator domain-containing protein n=1 Tax=Dyella japonica TaxID=231455 RepID=A0ABV2JUG9_9GAMM|nr:Mor transcription activator family protein [Dyella sp.]MDR3444707.1 Mor transcription activator family protein [Dyella sp.]